MQNCEDHIRNSAESIQTILRNLLRNFPFAHSAFTGLGFNDES